MKKQLLLIFCLFLATILPAQVVKTISITTAGTLSAQLTPAEDTTITNLTVTGTIDSSDFVTMNNMSKLAVIDISGTTVIGNKIPAKAFISNLKLNSIILPSTITLISDYAFNGCRYLDSINIPSTVTSVGKYAFDACYGLTSVAVPSSVTSIGAYAFNGCFNLVSVSLPSTLPTIEAYMFCNCPKLTTINIPSSLTSVGGFAFYQCSSLKTITIPSSVTSIGGSAFRSCSGLTSIKVERLIPPDISSSYNVFLGVKVLSCILNVPEGSKTAFQVANQWKDFTNIVEYLKPVITMTTTKAIDSVFSFRLAASADKTPIQVDFGDGNLFKDTISILGKTINGTLIGSQTVKVYGTGITKFNCVNEQLTSLDVSQDTALNELVCSTNKLTSLDISKNSALRILYCYRNQLAGLDLTNNTALTVLNCIGNQLSILDVGKNIALDTLYCSINKINTLDVTKNSALKLLYCNQNLLTSLLTDNPELTFLDCSMNHLTALDIRKDKAMSFFYCQNNKLSSLLTDNPKLGEINCIYNQLAALDLSKDTSIYGLSCYNNKFTFSTLPLKKIGWTYFYIPQYPVSIVNTIFTGIELDLSSEYLVNGNSTVYTWKTQSGTTLLEGTDYTISNGKIIFLKAQVDSVYCEMTNTTFPDFTVPGGLKTTYTKVTKSTGIEEKEIKKIEIYPHRKTIYINSPYDAQLSIFDINGRLIISKQIYSGMNDIQMQYPGVYLVKVTRDNESVVRKVLIE